MNLVNRPTKESRFSYFRTFQYSYLIDYLNNMIDYCLYHGFYTDGTRDIKIKPVISYKNYNYKALDSYLIKLNNNPNYTPFLNIVVPRLVDNTFFILKDVRYIPAVYAVDYPIVIKKASVLLSSLFFPITMYHKDNRVIISRNNFTIESFFQLLFPDNFTKQCDLFGIDNIRTVKESETINRYSSVLNCKPDRDKIINKLNKLFFDRWTHELYTKLYGFADIVNVVAYAATNQSKHRHFTDLRYKRLVFLEPLMRPIAKAVSFALKQNLEKQNEILYLNVNPDAVLSNFIKVLHSNFYYDTVNGFTSILSHNVCFKNPFGSNRLPFEVSAIHPTHKNRICPVSIGSQNPGERVSLVPTQDIDFKFGIFEGLSV